MVLLREIARDLGYPLDDLRSELSKVGINPYRVETAGGGRKAEYLSAEDADAVYSLIRHMPKPKVGDRSIGWFYCIRLQPVAQPSFIKLGYSSSPVYRLRTHQTTCPNAIIVRQWPCRRRWEKTAIDACTIGQVRLGPEQFEIPDLEPVIARIDQFFSILPVLPLV